MLEIVTIAPASQPGDIARLVETTLMLPNNASISEMLVHCQFEPML